MAKRDTLENQLVNYDMTRKVYAVKTLDILNRMNELEASKETPNMETIADLSNSIALILGAVQ